MNNTAHEQLCFAQKCNITNCEKRNNDCNNDDDGAQLIDGDTKQEDFELYACATVASVTPEMFESELDIPDQGVDQGFFNHFISMYQQESFAQDLFNSIQLFICSLRNTI